MGDGSNLPTITVDSGAGNIIVGSASSGAACGNLILANNLAIAQNSTSGTLTIDRPISESGGSGTVTKPGAGTKTLSADNGYTGATTINNGSLVGVVGGSCSNSAVTVAATSGNSAAVGVAITDNTKSWTCLSLNIDNSAGVVSSGLNFDFAVAPSTTVAPLNIIGAATFTTTPTVTVALGAAISVTVGNSYPLMTWASTSGTLPTAATVTTTTPFTTIAGHLTNVGNTNYLVIDSVVGPQPLRWAVSGAGTWDTSSINWSNNFGVPEQLTRGSGAV